jgi:hypothetical protein
MAEENSDGGGWMDAVKSVGSRFGQAAASAGSDWLDSAVAGEQEAAAQREVARFKDGPAMAARQRYLVERDQNIGAQPRNPRANTPAGGGGGMDAAGMGGGFASMLASPMGMLMIAGTAVGLYVMANK